MTLDATLITYMIGTAGMLTGLLPCLWLLSEDGIEGHFGYLLIIPAFAALSYAVMGTGIGKTTFQGYEVPFVRYLDWAVTTPVLVGYAAYVAGMDRGWIIGSVVADIAMIAFGWTGIVLAPPGQWVAFALSSLCYLGLLGVLYGALPSYAKKQPSERRRLARILQNHVGLLWVTYPIVWAFGPGAKMISPLAIAIIITFMDVAAKVPYVYFVYRARRVFETGASETRAGSAVSADRPAVTGMT